MSSVPTPSGNALAPSDSLMANLCGELSRYAPFAQMDPADVRRFVEGSSQVYFAPGEAVLTPSDGAVTHLMLIRQGTVTGRNSPAVTNTNTNGHTASAFQYAAGDLFPIGAVMGQRAVTSWYHATEDVFCLRVPLALAHELAAQSAPFSDLLNRRVQQFLALSQRALQSAYASQTLSEQSLERPLSALGRRAPVSVGVDASLREALSLMHERRVGSVLVLDADSAVLGILTRHDLLSRVTLPQVPLTTPIREVMSSPVLTLTEQHTAHDAVLLMARQGVRHVPITDGGRVVSLVSERDLFALQRLSLKQLSTSIRAARDIDTLKLLAVDLQRFARNLIGQGVGARQLTELVSHLNDVLTERIVQMLAEQSGVDLQRMCWLAFGSEGRSEQTISTDQDNGLIFTSDDPKRDRPAWLAFARRVNEALDACGYPLCKGNIMASNPACCLTADEWLARFDHWMEHGAPHDLLNASIYFDLRPVAGRVDLARPLTEHLFNQAKQVPRFIKQMADNALRNRVPLNWVGAVETQRVDGRDLLDIKLHGSVIYVDTARLYALAHGTAVHGTRARFEALAKHLKVAPAESEAWITGFEFLQMLRLRVQSEASARGDTNLENPNLLDLGALNDIDRRVLKESLRVARRLQQRIEMDYQR